MKKSLGAIAVAATMAVAPAYAVTVVDQSQTLSVGGYGQLNFPNQTYGQSFTPAYATSVGAGFYIPDVSFSASSGNVTITLKSVTNSSVLASGTVAATKGNWADVFWSPVTLKVGWEYFLYISSNTNLYASYANGDAYAGGQMFSGASRLPTSWGDLTFRTYTDDGVAAAVPEAATWGMMIAGFGMIGCAMRRRSAVRTRVRFA